MAASLSPSDVELLICGSALGAHPGAEVVGIVSAAGESAAHLADRCVIVPRLLPCGECEPCRRGRVAVCATRRPRPRHLETREVVPAGFLLPLEPPFVQAVPPADSWWWYAALSDALLAPYSGLVRVGQS
ncbi:MAG TPA: alcohol dehydrogenase catalytic domain-containing protein, partial [Pseudomonadota bacterium]|nr:alcohol dehydrogenase catalytic domain-containing protein [Pseudomonadota bacterium]